MKKATPPTRPPINGRVWEFGRVGLEVGGGGLGDGLGGFELKRSARASWKKPFMGWWIVALPVGLRWLHVSLIGYWGETLWVLPSPNPLNNPGWNFVICLFRIVHTSPSES